jgi:hypothetical protein
MTNIEGGEPYERLAKMRAHMAMMKKNQDMRGLENLKLRMAHRAATHTSWRQMKGWQFFWHEVNHEGNKPFVMGFV